MAAEDKGNTGKDRAVTPSLTIHLGGPPEVTPAKDAKVLYPARPWQADPSPWPSDEPPGGKLPPKS